MTTKSDNIPTKPADSGPIDGPVYSLSGRKFTFYDWSGKVMFCQDLEGVKNFKFEPTETRERITGEKTQDGFVIYVFHKNSDFWSRKIIIKDNNIIINIYCVNGKLMRKYCYIENVISYVKSYENEKLYSIIKYFHGKKSTEETYEGGKVSAVINYE